jgi:hypothetical protein
MRRCRTQVGSPLRHSAFTTLNRIRLVVDEDCHVFFVRGNEAFETVLTEVNRFLRLDHVIVVVDVLCYQLESTPSASSLWGSS